MTNRRDMVLSSAAIAGLTLLSMVADASNIYNINDYGAVGDGLSDDTFPIQRCLDDANGSLVRFPRGVFRITKPLRSSNGIRIVGEVASYVTHPEFVDANSKEYHFSEYSVHFPWASVVVCDGCNLIGDVDSDTVGGSDDQLKFLSNFVVIASSGAKHGIYLKNTRDLIVSNSTFIGFSEFGILTRGGITLSLEAVSYIDCGWSDLPSTYRNIDGCKSGAAIKFVANHVANDLVTIVPSHRPTTFSINNCFIWNRNHTSQNKSGYRAAQISGLNGGRISGLGTYNSVYLDVCAIVLIACHIENYGKSGKVRGDLSPRCLVLRNCQCSVLGGYYSIMSENVFNNDPIEIVNVGPNAKYASFSKF